ncbi:MAG TPA: hypothetical protein VF653_14165 [Methylomirabilota bacterium]
MPRPTDPEREPATSIELTGHLGRREAEALALEIRALARRAGVDLEGISLSAVADGADDEPAN